MQRAEDETVSRVIFGAAGASSAVAPVAHTLLGGRFLLERELGRGGAGTVFAARDLVLGQRIAVKVLHPDRVDPASRERLRREVRAARPGHPNAVAVYELHDTDGLHYLTLELVDGESLRTRLSSGIPVEVDRVVEIGRQVAEALAHLHGRGLVHRDVKPGNILLSPGGTSKLCDLGLARTVAEGVTVTETEMVVGTPAYMAPEQAMGGQLEPASDVYALGLTLFQALTGEVPLKADTALATLSRRQRERPPSARSARPDCPSWLDRLIRRMLVPAARERPTAAQVACALTVRRSPWRPRRGQLVAAAAALVVLAAGVAGTRWLRGAETIEIQVSTDSVSGRGRDGSVTWFHRYPALVAQSEIVDLDGDGRVEVVVVTEPRSSTSGRDTEGSRTEIEVRRLNGRVVTRLVPDEIVRWGYPFPVQLGAKLAVLDLDHDGVREIVVVCMHAAFYPTAILAYWTDQGRWDHVLNHSGYVYDVEEVRAEDGVGFWFLGVNNRLGVLPVVSRVNLAIQPGTRGMDQGLCASPPEGSGSGGHVVLAPYVILNEAEAEEAAPLGILGATEDGGIRLVRVDGSVLELDRFANPIPGPNVGRDLRAERELFAQQLQRFSEANQPDDPAHVLQIHDEIARRSGSLLAEAPYRVALDLMTAGAQARAGDIPGGLERLRALVQIAPWDDPTLRLAHLEALVGNFDGAGALLWEVMQRSIRPRARYDAPLLYGSLAIARRDRDTVEWVSRFVARGRLAADERVEAGMTTRARLWWDVVEPQDLEVVGSGYMPAAGAMACLARWRVGSLRPDDAAAMARGAVENPDVEVEYRLAEAAALMASGRAAEAVERLDRLGVDLEMPAHEDFSARQLLELGRALHAVALAAAGRPDRARESAAVLLDEVDPELLPGILVRELLAELDS